MPLGVVPVVRLSCGENEPPPLTRIVTRLLSFSATARSSWPSPAKSPATIALTRAPRLSGVPASGAKPPPGWRISTDTLPSTKFVTARSVRPSPLKSAAAAALGPAPTANGEPASCVNPPPAWRRYTDTLLLEPFTVATSGRPSPLKSAVTREYGSLPTVYVPSLTNAAQAVLAPTSSAIAASAATIILTLTGPIIPVKPQ